MYGGPKEKRGEGSAGEKLSGRARMRAARKAPDQYVNQQPNNARIMPRNLERFHENLWFRLISLEGLPNPL